MNGFLDRLRGAWTSLAPRERLLLGGAGATLLTALVWLALVGPALASLDRARARVETAEREITVAQRAAADLRETSSRLASVEQRIKSGPRGNIFTTLEELAKKSAVKVESMEPQASPPQESVKETKVQVALKQVTLAQVVSFLHGIESAPQLLSVKSLRIRTRAEQKEDLLDVTFTVSSFEMP